MRRAGGCAAPKAMRAAPLEENIKPVRGGMEGGQYNLLSGSGAEKINEFVMGVLENIGFKHAIPACIAACEKAGATFKDDPPYFPRQLVLDTIKMARRGRAYR